MSTIAPVRDLRRRAGVATAATLAALLIASATIPPAGAATAPPSIVAATSDTGVIDYDGDGRADTSSYGVTNGALSVGEQGGDGWDLRLVAPFNVPESTRQAIAAGARATLSVRVWRTTDLLDRRLVVTALPGGLAGRDDYSRSGIEVSRTTPTAGRMTIDVTEAIRRTTTSTITFRFALDARPARGDGRTTQVNIATANADSAERPVLSFSAPTGTVATTTTTRPTSTTTTRPTTTTTAAPSVAPPSAGSLVWSDEFNGSTLNRAWSAYHNTYGDGNNEIHCYTPNNVSVSGGTLKISARRQTVSCPGGSTRSFTSGFIGTRETGTYFPRYGRFEMRAKVPHAQGLWPAFWLRHRNGAGVAEADVMEYFHAQVPGRATQTLHLDGRANITKKVSHFENASSSPGWHVWSVDIAPVSNGVRFTFAIDGTTTLSYVDTQRRWATAASASGTWDMAINMSVGGNWVGRPDDALGYLRDLNRCAQSGTPPNGCSTTGIRRATFSPDVYEIDYVRVYSNG